MPGIGAFQGEPLPDMIRRRLVRLSRGIGGVGRAASYSPHPGNTAGSLPVSTPPLDFLPYRVCPMW